MVNGLKPNTAAESSLVSALLGWEKTQTLNIGFDLGMLDNRFNLNFDYFQRKSIDMVGPGQELPTILGIAVPNVNNLNMTSKGWELQVNWQDRIGQVGYRVSLNLSDAQTEVTEYPNLDKTFFTKDSDGNIVDNYWKGKKLGEIWGFKTVGMAKTDQEIQDYIAIHDQSRLPNIGNNIWKAGDIMYANLEIGRASCRERV